jgi:hypothetical protein
MPLDRNEFKSRRQKIKKMSGQCFWRGRRRADRANGVKGTKALLIQIISRDVCFNMLMYKYLCHIILQRAF